MLDNNNEMHRKHFEHYVALCLLLEQKGFATQNEIVDAEQEAKTIVARMLAEKVKEYTDAE